MKLVAALAIGLAAASTPALADAVTYRGTIGDLPVVVELSEEPGRGVSGVFGRYFYERQGVDIPLQPVAGRAQLSLAEELPCDVEAGNCPEAGAEKPANPPLGASWTLDVTRRGAALEGEWRNGSARALPVKLERVGTRPFEPAEDATPASLTEFATGLYWQGTVLTPETSPYDYLKVTAVKLAEDDPVEMQDGSFRFVADPRTLFQYPRVVDLGGTDIVPANTYLEQRHWTMTLDALWCKAQVYQGFGWNEFSFGAGTLGEYDNEVVSVHYLSPTVMSWTQSGSLYCGGAHPYNHHEFHNLDVRSGTPLDLSRIFAGWQATDYDDTVVPLDTARVQPGEYQWGPDAELADFVKQHRLTDEQLGFGAEGGCPIDELIETNLAISFKGDDTVLFALDGLPHVMFTCGADLYEAPIAELAALLTDEAAKYFPSLAD